MITIQRETVRQARQEAELMFALHYAEVGQHDMSLDVDWSKLEQLCDDGMFFVITARCDGKLVAYNAFIICRHLHYNATIAQNDVIFVHPDYRGGRIAVRLIKHAETALFAIGVKKIYYHAKPTNHLSALLERLDYQVAETVHATGVK